MVKGACASELVIHGVNGFTYELDENAWIEGLKEVVDKDLSEISKNALETVYFGWEEATDKYFEHYLKILEDYKNKK